jgi:hypothetical protein
MPTKMSALPTSRRLTPACTARLAAKVVHIDRVHPQPPDGLVHRCPVFPQIQRRRTDEHAFCHELPLYKLELLCYNGWVLQSMGCCQYCMQLFKSRKQLRGIAGGSSPLCTLALSSRREASPKEDGVAASFRFYRKLGTQNEELFFPLCPSVSPSLCVKLFSSLCVFASLRPCVESFLCAFSPSQKFPSFAAAHPHLAKVPLTFCENTPLFRYFSPTHHGGFLPHPPPLPTPSRRNFPSLPAVLFPLATGGEGARG